MKPLSILCKETCNIAQEVAQFIAAELDKVQTDQIEVKDLNQLVSYVDTTSEKRLIAALQKILPESGFIAEENTVAQNRNKEWQWIIDPLDGTTNFLHHIPSFAISIGLMHKEEIVLGVVLEINRMECFSAWKNGGAYLNGQPIQVSQNPLLKNGLFATGFPYYDFSIVESYLKVLQYFIRETRGIRRLGAAAVDLCYVACGRFDGFWEHSLSPWDVAAGSLIVQEAGGVVTDFKGGKDYLFGREIVASSRAIEAEFFAAVSEHLG
ncbi:MAG: inositol monophosphatase family protein [Chitinophagales bacterium]